jgi:predicted transcriptional regulator
VEPTVNSGENDALRFVSVATDIVSAYVSSNAVARTDLAALIGSVHAALRTVGSPKAAEPADRTPRVSVKKSITPDFLISLEDGRPYKALKRHLAGLGLTPENYRRKWQLPLDYPMVAPNYAIRRSELARKHGLGRKGVVVPDQPARAKASGKRKASVETLNDA